MKELLKHLSSLINVSDELNEKLNQSVKTIELDKGDILISNNERCSNLYFINRGMIRGYYYLDGKEITSWFAQENEFATCFYAFITKSNSFETIQAIESCSLIEISYEALQNLYSKFPETEHVGRIITENYYIKLEERLLNIQFKSAKERYENLLKTKPTLIQRAALGQIASYLGITQETLSRIRTEL